MRFFLGARRGPNPARLGFTLAATLGLAAATFFGDRVETARADDDPSSQATVTATQKGKTVHISVTPNGSQYFINSDYPLTINLTAKGSGALDKAQLTKADGTYVPSGTDGHALSVSFDVGAPTGLSGQAKLVVCTATGCGNPTKFSFETK